MYILAAAEVNFRKCIISQIIHNAKEVVSKNYNQEPL
jgi:hypothetical protein